MIELFAIILQFFVFFIISSFPLNPKNLNYLLRDKGKSFNYIDCHAVNIMIFFYILLFASFSNINLKIVYIIVFFSSLIFFAIRWKEFFLLINKKNILRFVFFFIVSISIFISIAHSPKLQWDGFHWIAKALVFLNDTEITNLSYTPMPEYPHLGAYVWAFFWKNSLLELEYFGRFFYIYFYLVSIFTIFNVLNIKSEKVIFVIIFSIIFITYDPYLFGGYQDYLIFSTLLISSRFIYVLNFNKEIEYKKIFLIFFIMSIMMWFKDEGIFYFLIFGSLLIFLNKHSIKSKILLLSSILILIYFQQYLQKNIIGIYGFNVDFFGQRTLDQILNFNFMLIKSIAITKHLIIAFIKYPMWILILFSLLTIHLIDKKSTYLIKYFTYALLFNVLFIYGVYLHDPNPSEFILSVTLDRVIFQTSSFYILIFVIVLNKYQIFNHRI